MDVEAKTEFVIKLTPKEVEKLLGEFNVIDKATELFDTTCPMLSELWDGLA